MRGEGGVRDACRAAAGTPPRSPDDDVVGRRGSGSWRFHGPALRSSVSEDQTALPGSVLL